MDGLAVWTASGLENRDDSFGMGVRLLGHPPIILEPCMGFEPIPSETQSEMLPLHQARPISGNDAQLS